MKKTKILYICLLIIASAILMDSCVKGKGDEVTEIFDVESFSGIDNRINANIHITQAQTQSVEIVAQQNIIKNISLVVNDGILIIKFKQKAIQYDPIDINISIPRLSSLDISGSGNINTTNTFDSCGAVSMQVSGSGNIDAHINSNSNTSTKISGSGNISLTGISPNQDIKISGSGYLHAFTFHTDNTIAKLSGSGTCELKAENTLNVTISGSGDVYYKGHPAITRDISGSGNVHDSN